MVPEWPGGHLSDSALDSHTGHAEVGEQPPAAPTEDLPSGRGGRGTWCLLGGEFCCPGHCAHPPPTCASQRAHLCSAHVPAASAPCPDPETGAPWAAGKRPHEPVTSRRGTWARDHLGPQSLAASRWTLPTARVVLKSPSEPGPRTGASMDISAVTGQWPPWHLSQCWLPSSAPRRFAMRTGQQPSRGARVLPAARLVWVSGSELHGMLGSPSSEVSRGRELWMRGLTCVWRLGVG